jgi:hypothetical protein
VGTSVKIRVGGVLLAFGCCLAAACGSNAPTDQGVPNTPANLAVCKMLHEVVSGNTSPQKLSGLVFESSAPITQRLRQDVATYVAQAVENGSGTVQQAQATALSDCGSMA